jgi:hypothetical protein
MQIGLQNIEQGLEASDFSRSANAFASIAASTLSVSAWSIASVASSVMLQMAEKSVSALAGQRTTMSAHWVKLRRPRRARESACADRAPPRAHQRLPRPQ